MTKETKNKSKIILPLAITGVLLVGGVGSCSVVKYNKTKTASDANTEVVDDENNSNNDIYHTGDDNKDKNDSDEYQKENDVELNRDEDGNITFTKREDTSEDYSHLKDIVRNKVEEEEDNIYFTFDDDGNLVANNGQDKDKNSDLLASIDKEQIIIPSDKDSDKTDSEDTPKNDLDLGNDIGNSDNGNNVGDNDTDYGNEDGSNDEVNNGSDDNNIGDSDSDSDNGSDDNDGNDDGGSGDDSDDNDTPDPKPIDKEDLNNAIASANALLNDNHRYMTNSWNNFTRAFDKAINARDNNVSQSTVDQATNNLWNAINNLEVKPPIIAIGGLEKLEGKDKNITTDRMFNINVDAKDVDGKDLRKSVKLNGFPVLSITGNYTLFLKEGINKIVVETSDSFGGKTTEEFEIKYVKDVTPELTHTPISNENVKDGIFTFETEAFDYKEDKLDVIVTHNGEKISVIDGKVEVELTEGINEFKLSATDEKHNKTKEIEFAFEFTDDGFIEGDDVDYNDPTLNVNGLDENNIEDGKITFTVDAIDGYGRNVTADVIHNGEVVESNNNSYTVDLIDGQNNFEVSMTDKFGNTITEDFVIDYDEHEHNNPKVKPELNINGIDSDYVTVSEKEFTFTATAMDDEEETESDDIVNEDEQSDVDDESIEDEADVNEEESQEDTIIEEDEPVQEEVYEQILINGNIGNSNKEFDSLQEAKTWAEQEVNNDSSDWKDYEFEFIQLDYHEVNANGEKVEGSERSTWSVEFTQKKEVPAENVEEIEETLVVQSDDINIREDEAVVLKEKEE